MKHLLLLLFLVAAPVFFAQKQAKLTVTYSFENIEEGYDHQTKTQVYVDGQLKGESQPHVQSKQTTFTVDVPAGNHTVRIVNLAYYEGKWEERSIANNYNCEGFWENTFTLKKKNKVTLIFDLNLSNPVVKVK